jgi:hypothetical protein
MTRQQRELHLLSLGSSACCGASLTLTEGLLLPLIFAALAIIAAIEAQL